MVSLDTSSTNAASSRSRSRSRIIREVSRQPQPALPYASWAIFSMEDLERGRAQAQRPAVEGVTRSSWTAGLKARPTSEV